jgi:pyruvate,water dikinase
VNPVLEACKKCFASIFTDRAFYYRQTHGFDHLGICLSIGVQKMVRSDLACSGVMFSLDTETGFTNAVLINASYGLGENIVQGAVNPDEFMVFKPTLKQGFQPDPFEDNGHKGNEAHLRHRWLQINEECTRPAQREEETGAKR